ncbi:DUF5631 domain-containing protein [Mycobacterium sp. pUA109]|uniref:DUF5631 domain-containing protein n=1 Tax=Mycobacterium sp. pUA109 TaxID=3238982 RepID=UPI00351BE057
MGIFGRRTARRRLRKAARQSLATPAFSPPIDSTPWVLGGLWPAELAEITAQNAAVAEYLNADLQRIANSANERIQKLRQANLTAVARQAEEERVIKAAREFAVLRVESTVRAMRNERPAPDDRGAAEGTTTVLRPPPARGEPEVTEPEPVTDRSTGERRTEGLVTTPLEVERTAELGTTPLTVERTAELGTTPLTVEPTEELTTRTLREVTTDTLDTDSAKDASTDTLAPPPGADEVTDRQAETPRRGDGPTEELTARTDKLTARRPGEDRTDKLTPKHAAADVEPTPAEPESGHTRLKRLLAFVARQQPELCWAVGDRADGTTVLVTDLAHGWIPPGIALPAEVRLREPGRRGGTVAALLGPTTLFTTYAPGDRLGWTTDFAPIESALQSRELPAVSDLGRQLSDATQAREDLPRLVHAAAEAAAAGSAVADSEMDLLRVHLDTARYQLLTQYPDVDAALLLNCLLLAATEGLAAGDTVSANYHFSWFQVLDRLPPGD